MIKAQPAAKAERGHNSKVKVGGPIVADRLQSFVDRIERLMEERAALQGDIKDIYSEVKGVGYDVKTLRKVIQLRGMDAADRAEQEALLDTYLHALGMVDRIEARAAAGESARQIAKAEGVSKSTAHRVSQKRGAENGERVLGQGDTPPINSLEGDAPNVARGGEASAEERAASASPSPPPAEPDLAIPDFLRRLP